MPEYYRHTLANGKTVMETAPTIQWGYLIYLTVLRLCQYFGAKEECGFCDINHNWRQHKKAGRPYTGVKPIEDVLEALELIDRYDDGHEPRVHAHRRLGHLDGRRARRGGLLRPLRAGDRGALPGPLDRQGRRAGAAEGRRAALQGLRHLDLPPELRGLGQAALLAHLAGQGALRRPRGVAPADPRRGRGLRAAQRDPELRRGRRDGEAVRLRHDRRGDRLDDRGARLLHEPRHHAALHDLVPGADDAARPRQPGRRAARVPRAPARGLPRRARPPRPRSRRPATASAGAGNAVFSVSSFMDVPVSRDLASTRRARSGTRRPTRS